MVARHQHIGHQPVAVALDRAAQRLQLRTSVFRSAVAISPNEVRRVIWDAA